MAPTPSARNSGAVGELRRRVAGVGITTPTIRPATPVSVPRFTRGLTPSTTRRIRRTKARLRMGTTDTAGSTPMTATAIRTTAITTTDLTATEFAGKPLPQGTVPA